MSDDNNNKPQKSPEETFRSGVKSLVSGINSGLATLQSASEGIRKPAMSAWSTASKEATYISNQATYTYQRRHEYAPEIIGGSAVLGGGLAALRRGRLAGVLGAAMAGSAAYLVVYDEIKFDHVPELIFGKKE